MQSRNTSKFFYFKFHLSKSLVSQMFLFVFLAFMCSNIVNDICNGDDGGDSRYSTSIRRRWKWLTIGNIFNVHVKFISHSCNISSSRIFMYFTSSYLFIVNPIHVFTSHFVFNHQFKCRIVGNERSSSETNEKGT